APQYPLAIYRACWQGEPVLAVVAQSRREAEDALQTIVVEWTELPAITSMEGAIAPGAPLIHPDLGDNVCFTRTIDTGAVDEAFARAHAVVEQRFAFGRHTGVPLETRSVLADYNASEQTLVVYQSHQAPHMMQDLYARHFNLPESSVRVLCRDIGGSFGLKVHAYPDDFATVALSILLRRPVKHVADRLESFVSDIHAREHIVHARLAACADGEILAFEIDDLAGAGAYSMYPRTSAIEGNQVINNTGGPYRHQQYLARLKVVFQNKTPMSQYRGVGHPIACAVTEGIIDLAARKLGIDPLEMRRRNVVPDDAYPFVGASGVKLERLSHQQCLDKLESLMDYDGLRHEQAALRSQGVYRGIGLSVLIEQANPSTAFYGIGGARIASRDGATMRLDASGDVVCLVSVGEQGQGTETIFAQIAADTLGLAMTNIRVHTGDTSVTPYGGGNWASRGAGIGGEAVLLASQALKVQILEIAAAMLTRPASELNINAGRIVEAGSGANLLELSELARVAYFRPDTLPAGVRSELVVTRHYDQRDYPFVYANGAHACLVEVDIDTGFVKLLKYWAVEDCGRVINPMLVDEQLRGAIVQGIGGALFEECLYDEAGSLRNGSLADYLVPMASEMPDIIIGHVETPTQTSQLGAKGTAEAGTTGAPAAVMNAINDALASLGASVASQPITPEKILMALKKV
ncbi:MAG: xanthine dehydrogenase family protein molybdopterin-binding subunit, partial [Candidatus Limnocylindria bacterium]